MRGLMRRSRSMILVSTLISFALWEGPLHAQEVIFLKSLGEAEKAIGEAREAQADVYAPNDYALALLYLTQAKDEAVAYKTVEKDKKDTHVFSARKSGEVVNLLAEKARYQAKVATTKAIEVKVDREITAIKAQIVETFNTDVSRSFTTGREDLLGELSLKEGEWKDARKAREQAQSELKRLTVEGEAQPVPK
ncbi:MAG: DUF4398 domain-containing protein [candidate division NC10 bacterium]|nr:DUF4398 domain-containing protein [candidate division NC10 bacterium]